jgi:hypothetical protein
MSSKRMPQLVIDEVILLVDTYFQLQDIKDTSMKNELIDELSNNMKKLPFFPNIRDDKTFRSPDGMRMCLANVGFIDPDNTSKFGHGSELQRRVFEYYYNKKLTLRKIAMAIMLLAQKDFVLDPTYEDFIGGQIIASYHKHLEKTNKVVNYVLNENKQTGRVICGLCGFDLSKTYKCAEDLIDVHVNIPIEDYAFPLEIYPSRTILLCPTCHKLVHLNPQLYSVELAKERIKGKM